MTDILKIKQNNQWVSIPAIKGDPGEDGIGIPEGGTTGQVLAKASGTDYDTEWTSKQDVLVSGTNIKTINNESILDSGNVSLATSSDISTAISTLLSTMYPVGAIYIGTQATCPMASLITGSTWELVGSDKVLQGAGTRGTVGTTIDEKLPTHTHSGTTGNVSANHTHGRGSMNITGGMAYSHMWDSDPSLWGAFYRVWDGAWRGSAGGGDNNFEGYTAFNAANSWSGSTSNQSANHNHSYTTGAPSSATYQADAHVQPDAYLVNIWRRTA